MVILQCCDWRGHAVFFLCTVRAYMLRYQYELHTMIVICIVYLWISLIRKVLKFSPPQKKSANISNTSSTSAVQTWADAASADLSAFGFFALRANRQHPGGSALGGHRRLRQWRNCRGHLGWDVPRWCYGNQPNSSPQSGSPWWSTDPLH